MDGIGWDGMEICTGEGWDRDPQWGWMGLDGIGMGWDGDLHRGWMGWDGMEICTGEDPPLSALGRRCRCRRTHRSARPKEEKRGKAGMSWGFLKAQ